MEEERLMNNDTLRKEEGAAAQPAATVTAGKRGRGRPRRWANAAEKQRAHRREKAVLQREVADLLAAVRNAHWEEPALQQVVNWGDDRAVLVALTAYYRARHWQKPRLGS